tara:strand:+ start:73 stop:630 length:558 start_codon:yes stop_codon:yes gene_type:complete
MCIVCDREGVSEAQKFIFWDSNSYCSYYCQRFDELKLSKVLNSDSPHQSNIWIYPAIIEQCETCGADFELRWAREKSNRAFCSQACNNTNPKRKRAKKHYFPLKILKHATKPMIAQDIAKRTDHNLKYRMTPNGVSQLLISYIKHGYVKRTDTKIEAVRGRQGYPLATYSMTPLGKSLPIKSYLI